MIVGVPVALAAVTAAFWRGTGLVMSFVAFAFVSLQVLFLSIPFGFEFGPAVPLLAVVMLAALGWFGVHRLRNPVPQLAMAGAWHGARSLAADSASPFAEFSPPGASPPSPTASPVDVESVIGRWQFYCDATCRTVVLHFRDDGTYTQTVIDNRGDITPYPGGTWRLDGPDVEVTGYVAAGQESGLPMTWPMVDTPAGVRLYGGDPGAFFVMTRRSG